MPRYLALPKAAFADVSALVQLPEDKLAALVDLFSSAASAHPQSPEFLQEVAGRLQLDQATVDSIVVVCQFLLNVVEDGKPAEGIINDVREFLSKSAPPNETDIVKALDGKRRLFESLLKPKPERSRALKVNYLAHGLHPTVDSVRTICELRPVFDCPKEHEVIVGYVPTVCMEIESSDTDGNGTTVLLQLSPKMVQSFKQVIERTEEKLRVIRAKFGNELLGE